MKDKIWSLCLTERQKVIFSIVRYFPQGIVYFLAKKEKNGDEWYDGEWEKLKEMKDNGGNSDNIS